ncbi:MAG: oligogalacturonate lyase family protein [Planctomycetota bacterium]|nr:oligogalacturonate lyase family protein [Planctomycetota bacterium]
MRYLASVFVMVAALSANASAQETQPSQGVDSNTGASFPVQIDGQQPPKQWIDKDTGHRVVRLSDEPNSQSLYFHQNAFSPDGTRMAFTAPTGIYQVELSTGKIELILAGSTSRFTQTKPGPIISMMVAGRRTGRIFFTKLIPGDPAEPGSGERSVWWIDPVTKEQHEIGVLPKGVSVGTVNSDETLLAGAVTYSDGRNGAATRPVTAPRGRRVNLGARWAQHLPMALATMNALTGEVKTFNPSNDWDNHFQFSPTDPTLLMYCHEGPWQNNDRVWTIRADGTDLFKVHQRTMINEIWGHEFWASDGRTIWYQLQTPRGEGAVGWIAGYSLDTHQQTWYLNAPDTGSIHVNVSRDGSLFAGDGGNGAPWIFLFTPHLARNMAQGIYDASGLIQPGHLDSERLVNMSKHNYALEPNVNFTPDMKWIIFRSNMFGPSYAFAVEIAKAK